MTIPTARCRTNARQQEVHALVREALEEPQEHAGVFRPAAPLAQGTLSTSLCVDPKLSDPLQSTEHAVYKYEDIRSLDDAFAEHMRQAERIEGVAKV